MKETEKVAEELFDKIRSRFEDVSIGDESAKSTVVPEEARFFNFDFVFGYFIDKPIEFLNRIVSNR